MSYGGIDFGHVLAFQIKCMMSNQYGTLVEAIGSGKINDIIVACLRLGWNDAFRHVSKNVSTRTTIAELSKLTKNPDWNSIYIEITNRQSKFKGKNFEISDDEKNKIILMICSSLVNDFKTYLNEKSTTDRMKNISTLMNTQNFKNKFTPIKDINAPGYELCFGHIQKLFNMATKLLLCLVVSAEQASSNGIQVKLKNKVGSNCVYLTDNNWWQRIFDKDNFDADCPLDSIILDSIEKRKINNINKSASGHTKYSQIVWSKLGTKEPIQNYNLAQIEIKNINAKTHNNNTNCNLLFDFENWN